MAQSVPTTQSAGRATIDLLLDEPIRLPDSRPAIIEPNVHGHFVEHLGGVVYDGIWVGPDSKIAHVDGIRRSLVESLRKLGPPVIRWPGGCFADRYHWRDGIGLPASRPRRFSRWGEGTETNAFGLHEFLRFCRLVGAEPYLAANVGTGHPEEFQQWVEYCNAPAGRTTLADERVANGQADPFRVRYWGVGNESWGCGGKFTPEDYCTQYRRFTDWVPVYGVPLTLIASGPSSNDLDWTRRFFKKWADGAKAPLQGWSPHYYCGTAGTSTDFTVDQWYQLLSKAAGIERLVTDQWAILGEFDPGRSIRLYVDEWGCWHPADKRIPDAYLYGQFSTMRDALVAALTLDTFHRHAEKVAMANVAQLVNCLHSLYMTEGDQLVETTNYHVFDMYSPHKGATPVGIRIQAPDVSYNIEGRSESVFRVNGSASMHNGRLTLTLVHTHASEPIEAVIRLKNGQAKAEEALCLAHEKLNAMNTAAHPREVVPHPIGAARDPRAGAHVVVLPPASIVRLQFTGV